MRQSKDLIIQTLTVKKKKKKIKKRKKKIWT